MSDEHTAAVATTARTPAGSDAPDLGAVALVHDYLNQRGGAERVVGELARTFPGAPVYTSIHRSASTWPELSGLDVRTSPLQRLPVDRRFRALFALYPLAFRSFGELDADIVLSSSSGWAHGVRTSPRALHVVYCYTPARWLYERPSRPVLARALEPARRWDQRAAARADAYLAISAHVARRIERVYGRQAPVVYPPVDTERFRPSARGERLLVVSRLLGYKRVDLAVMAATSAGIGLDVVGDGPELRALRSLAGPTVQFHGALGDRAAAELVEGCRALVLPGAEDFGLTAVEAQSAGKPVVAFGAGGALETVEDGFSGTFFARPDADALLEAVRRADDLTSAPAAIAARAQRFSAAAFRRRIVAVLGRLQAERTG